MATTDPAQPSLFAAPARARATDPPESHEAAKRVGPAVSRLEAIVLALLRAHPGTGMTSAELADHSGLERVTVSPRLKPLERKGQVYRNGERRDGSAVWRAK